MRTISTRRHWLLKSRNSMFASLLLVQVASAAPPEMRADDIFARVAQDIFIVEAGEALGSGVVVYPSVVVTNAHVVGTEIVVALRQASLRLHGFVVWKNDNDDIALIVVLDLKRKPVEFRAWSSLRVGEHTYAIGAPEGFELTMSDGIVSGIRTDGLTRYLQTSAAISHGSSGGGLFDSRGRLIGLTTFMHAHGGNLNFAVSVDHVRDSLRAQQENIQASLKLLREVDRFVGACPKGVEECRQRGFALSKNAKTTTDWKKVAEHFSLACDVGKDPISCRIMGHLYRDGLGRHRDESRALHFYKMACNKQDGEACADAALLLLKKTKGISIDERGAYVLASISCSLKVVRGCAIQGDLLASGRGVEKDVERGDALLNQACTTGNRGACYGLAIDIGEQDEAAAVRSAALFGKACSLEFTPACTALGKRYLRGRGVEKNEAAAFALFEKTCNDRVHSGCRGLAVLLQEGVGCEKNEGRAVNILKDACAAGDQASCTELGAWSMASRAGLIPDAKYSLSLFRRACTAGVPRACEMAAELFLDGAGGVQRNAKVAAEFLDRVCTEGEHRACNTLGFLFLKGSGVRRDEKQAFDLFQSACLAGGDWACGSLGDAYELGWGTEKSGPQAIEFLGRACERDVFPDCERIGRLLESGSTQLGIAQDAPKAAGYLRKACDGGVKNACTPGIPAKSPL